MGEYDDFKSKKNICTGLLAHVDAGKTTLSEAMLHTCGVIRERGRVDNQDTFLDTHQLERARGITIFSKQAVMQLEDLCITLLDTPGHVDFSAEMERALQVLDYAILVISGAEPVQGHTKTLWRLLKLYEIPTVLFINKMDLERKSRQEIMEELTAQLDDGCVDFSVYSDEFFESVSMCEESLLEQYLETGEVEMSEIGRLIVERKLFPCYFGSALKEEGVEEFLRVFTEYGELPAYGEAFGAKVFKISRDDKGNRLTHLKVTGGALRVRDTVSYGAEIEEKITQIRVYSGERFEAVAEATAGMVCAVTGLTQVMAGMGLGAEQDSEVPILEPVLSYQIQLPADCDPKRMLPQLRQLEEEEPQLHILWEESTQEIQAQIMGEVQLEVLQSLILERFGVVIRFGQGSIVYKETIATSVEGVGHFEPLRHYAEVHLLMEPGEPGSGLVFAADCSEDILSRNWQRLVLTHLEEKVHVGVLAGAPITDMRITLKTGRAHLKHTEGGDFRQATYRAVRQGLMEAQSVLLEPVYAFELEVPEGMTGRAMTDVDRMHGSCEVESIVGGANPGEGVARLIGMAPVATMNNYQKEVAAYTGGMGTLNCTLKGYAPCHNTEEVLETIGYNPEADLRNPTGSVFCAHGAGFVVSWDQVKEYMHLESVFDAPETEEERLEKYAAYRAAKGSSSVMDTWIGVEEVDAILSRAYDTNKRNSRSPKRKWQYAKRKVTTPVSSTTSGGTYKPPKQVAVKEKWLLVDGYNIIFAWPELKELAQVNIDGARGALQDILCDYQGMKHMNVMVVFDAYRVKRHEATVQDYHNIRVVFTKEAETADQYIEKFAVAHSKEYEVTVATSDGLEQVIIRSQGCRLWSAKDFAEELEREKAQLREQYLS